jgi:glutaminyl-peptide cyclotransferase
MIADRDLQIYQETNSLRFAPNLVRQIWQVARENNVPEFVPRSRYQIRDDHLPLNSIADIPACVVIDFDYPAWHTTADTPEQCSPDSLEKVGRVMLEWLRRLE